jgi:four helix bundle protein
MGDWGWAIVDWGLGMSDLGSVMRDSRLAQPVPLANAMAHTLEELLIHSKATEFWIAVREILDQPRVRRDCGLHKQISDANDSILSNMAEGFEQPTDEAFAKYVFHSKGSLAEVLVRSREARMKDYISQNDLAAREVLGKPLGAMMGGFIKYLRRSGFRDRGRFKNQQP